MQMSNVMVGSATSGCRCGGGAKSPQVGKKPGGCDCGCGGSGCSRCEGSEQGYLRPRFFSGQLLTEDDLQSLIDYVVGKNRLHNRMLFGEGVVCGLKVTKDVCDPRKIVVSSGYALDCCGNDIVVPCAVTLDVNQLIRDLRTRMLGKDCGDPCAPMKQPPPGSNSSTSTIVTGASFASTIAQPLPAATPPATATATKVPEKPTNTYCLYVRYCEQLSDPVAPYDGEEACGAGDCHDTRVREGFVFELRCAPEDSHRSDPYSRSVQASRTLQLQRAAELLLEADLDPTAAKRDAVLGYATNILSLDPFDAQAALLKNLADAGKLAPGQATRLSFGNLVGGSLIRWMRGLDCDVLLPDCPPCDDEGVLVSCFQVVDCEVTEICNVVRQPIFSAAFLHHLRLPEQWRQLLTYLCCYDRRKADTHTPTAIGRIPVDGGVLFNALYVREFRGDLAVEAMASTAAVAGAPAPAADAPQAPELTPEVGFLFTAAKERSASLSIMKDPDTRLTLVPQMLRTYAAATGIVEPPPVEAQDALERKIVSLDAELTQIKRVLRDQGMEIEVPATDKGAEKKKSSKKRGKTGEPT